jgi:hypothetical protein
MLIVSTFSLSFLPIQDVCQIIVGHQISKLMKEDDTEKRHKSFKFDLGFQQKCSAEENSCSKIKKVITAEDYGTLIGNKFQME